MSVLAKCDICGVVDFCMVIDGLTLCDVCWSDYEQMNDIEEFCDGDCRDCETGKIAKIIIKIAYSNENAKE